MNHQENKTKQNKQTNKQTSKNKIIQIQKKKSQENDCFKY